MLLNYLLKQECFTMLARTQQVQSIKKKSSSAMRSSFSSWKQTINFRMMMRMINIYLFSGRNMDILFAYRLSVGFWALNKQCFHNDILVAFFGGGM